MLMFVQFIAEAPIFPTHLADVSNQNFFIEKRLLIGRLIFKREVSIFIF